MNKRAQKAFSVSLKIFGWIFVAFSLLIMIFTIITLTTVDRNDRSIFGVKFYIVQTDSMSKSKNNKDIEIHFSAGDIVLIKEVKEKASLKEGDVIAFLSTNSASFGETITHMIREVKTNADGRVIGYITFGTNTGVNDEALVEPEYVLGKYAGKLTGLGNFFVFVKSTTGYIVCILLPFSFLIVYNGVNVFRLVKRYKKEQKEVMEKEKAELAAERKKNEETLKELQALKAELAQQQSREQNATETFGEGSPRK